MNHPTFGAAAAEYVRRDSYVFPVAPRGKTPLTKNGLNDASRDLGLVAAWWEDNPRANIGINAGASGLIVVDLDGKEAASTWADLAAGHGGHPRTLVARTGQGWHLYFAGDGPSSAGRVGARIDTRGRGGYTIAPPSIHSSGASYRWVGPAADPAPVPPWLLEALDRGIPNGAIGERRALSPGRSYTAYGRAALHAVVREMASAPEGERNDTLNALAYRCGRLAGAGQLEPDVARHLLVGAALETGLDAEEAEATFRSGFDAGVVRPVSLEARS